MNTVFVLEVRGVRGDWVVVAVALDRVLLEIREASWSGGTEGDTRIVEYVPREPNGEQP